MKKIYLSIVGLCIISMLFAQRRVTTTALVHFDIITGKGAVVKAKNPASIAVINTQTGVVAFETIIKKFSFTNIRVQEYFNSTNWMDSKNYPTARFEGKIANISEINFNQNGTYNVNIEGVLTVRNVAQALKIPVIITINGKGKDMQVVTDFSIKPDNYISNNSEVAKASRCIVVAEFK